MARGSHGVSTGEWFFEIKINAAADAPLPAGPVLPPPSGGYSTAGAGGAAAAGSSSASGSGSSSGPAAAALSGVPGQHAAHTRIGWSTERGDLEVPVGFDRFSYGYRDVEGTKFNQSLPTPYGQPYGTTSHCFALPHTTSRVSLIRLIPCDDVCAPTAAQDRVT